MNNLSAVRALIAAEPVASLLALLGSDGEETRIVGGALRNAVLGLPVADIDLATTMLPDNVSARAIAAGWHAVPTGIEHGTVTVHRDGQAFEVTTLREDIATDGRRAKVRFGRDFRIDAARRDFTMNALSMGGDGVLHDYFGGLADLAACRLRFIGDADQRIREDYLRALRFLRFSAAYGGGKLDPEGLAAVIRNRDGFARLSRERVRQEIMKLVVAGHAAPVIAEAEKAGLVAAFLGVPADVERFGKAIALADRHQIGLDPVARLAALVGGRAGDPAADWQTRLRLANAEIRTLRLFADALAGPGGEPRLFAYRCGPDAIAALILRVAAGMDSEAGLEARLAMAAQPAPHFLIGGDDLLVEGLGPGPELGAMLERIEAAWIAAGLPEDAKTQRMLMRDVLAGIKRAPATSEGSAPGAKSRR